MVILSISLFYFYYTYFIAHVQPTLEVDRRPRHVGMSSFNIICSTRLVECTAECTSTRRRQFRVHLCRNFAISRRRIVLEPDDEENVGLERIFIYGRGRGE